MKMVHNAEPQTSRQLALAAAGAAAAWACAAAATLLRAAGRGDAAAVLAACLEHGSRAAAAIDGLAVAVANAIFRAAAVRAWRCCTQFGMC